MKESIRSKLMDRVEENGAILDAANNAIWEFAETALTEERSSAYLKQVLAQNGFRIHPGAEGVPTSFIAEWGAGTPVIGLAAEYDALAGLSQERSTTCRPLRSGAPGHACGHCTLGAAVLGAAISLKEIMEREGQSGTLRFYGCPAEETLEGKVLMSRDHLFDDCDAALSWHPNDISYVWARKSVALRGMKFTFHGRSAHAGLDPWNGRSALDAVELMNVGANYLREHVQPSCRIQYVITDGGEAPNIVPARAEVWYALRAPERALVDELHGRLVNIAKGAALMTETEYDEAFISGCYDFLPNMTLAKVILGHMREVGAPAWTDDDRAFARELYRQIPESSKESTFLNFSLADGDVTDGLVNGIYDGYYRNGAMGASTDLGDVSWQIPIGCFSYASTVVGAPGHSWFYTAACGTGIGARGARAAAKVLALTGWDLLTDAELLAKAKREHTENTKDRPYVCPLG